MFANASATAAGSAGCSASAPKTLLLAWVPVIGDPLCSLAGWLRLPFWACVGYMAIGKFLRYLTVTWLLLRVPEGFWRQLLHWF